MPCVFFSGLASLLIGNDSREYHISISMTTITTSTTPTAIDGVALFLARENAQMLPY